MSDISLIEHPPRLDPASFIRENLNLLPVPAFPHIKLYTPHPASRLRRLDGPADEEGDPLPPYWAYVWGGGAVLVRHLEAFPQLVSDKRVLDLGSGSGLVAIAAALAGAVSVIAAETDPNGLAALALNAAANGVKLSATGADLTAGPPPEVDLILVGDLFYAPDLAERVSAFLSRCVAAGIQVVVGDPFRAYLPLGALELIAEYDVLDFGDNPRSNGTKSGVFAFRG